MTDRHPLCRLFFIVLLLCGCAKQPAPSLDLVLLHTNDIHSYVAGRDENGNACLQSGDCTGGMGRIAAVAQAERRKADNVLLFDAGDQFQGTLFFTVNGWPMLAALDNMLGYDAMTLGNHEFDKGCVELAAYVGALHYPVLAANLDAQPGCPLYGLPVKPYVIRNVRGIKVGIVGLANPDVVTLAAEIGRASCRERV